jgi:hypothetical protein
MNILNTLKETALWIWQLPQNLVGLILLGWYKLTKDDLRVYHKRNGRTYYATCGMPSGISLGNYIIMKWEYWDESMDHEYGHSIDSRRMGPIYLVLIGIPSICGNIYDRIFHKKWKYSKSARWYYNQPWERSADKNGKVDREAYLKRLEEMGY